MKSKMTDRLKYMQLFLLSALPILMVVTVTMIGFADVHKHPLLHVFSIIMTILLVLFYALQLYLTTKQDFNRDFDAKYPELKEWREKNEH